MKQARLGLILLLLIGGCSKPLTPEENSAQARIVAAFEQNIAQSFNKCFYATVDDNGQHDPRQSLPICRKALENLEAFSINEQAEPGLKRLLSSARADFIKAVKGYIHLDEYNLGLRKDFPVLLRRTCDGYAKIRKAKATLK